jgi:hypothetical protein
MKKCLLAIGIVYLSISNTAISAENDVEEKCGMMGKIAENIMSGRQAGVSIPRQMEVANQAGNDWLSDMMKRLIRIAYAEHRYSTSEMQMRTIEDFRDSVTLSCLNELVK